MLIVAQQFIVLAAEYWLQEKFMNLSSSQLTLLTCHPGFSRLETRISARFVNFTQERICASVQCSYVELFLRLFRKEISLKNL